MPPIVEINRTLQILLFFTKKISGINQILKPQKVSKSHTTLFSRKQVLFNQSLVYSNTLQFVQTKKRFFSNGKKNHVLRIRRMGNYPFYQTLIWINRSLRPFSKPLSKFFKNTNFSTLIQNKNFLKSGIDYRTLQKNFIKGKGLRFFNNTVDYNHLCLKEQIILRNTSVGNGN
jgi:hypothetical protein